MRTNISENARFAVWGKGPNGWFDVRQVSVSFDHPYLAPLEHATNIDFLNDAEGLSARLAVELTPKSTRELIRVLQATLALGEAERVKAYN